MFNQRRKIMWLNLRLKIRDFWKNNKYKVILAILIFIMVIVVNDALKNSKTPVTPSVSFTPHESIMDTEEKVPTSMTDTIDNWVENFYSACNNKEYEKAYELLSNEYRASHTLEELTAHINNIFNEKKIYIAQNYSNQKNIYVYKVKIMEDVLATGLTGKEELEYVEEMVTVKRNGKNVTFSIGEDILTESLNKTFENEYIKATVTRKVTRYDVEIYTIKIVNRTDYTIVLSDIIKEAHMSRIFRSFPAQPSRLQAL